MRPHRKWQNMGVYIHFPFCRHICDFCNYETRVIHKGATEEFTDALLNEITRYKERDDFSAAEITSLFFGGGTASLMPEQQRAAAVEALLRLTDQNAISEITLECEPGTISRAKLARARAVGVNRIGVCAQSFNDQELERLTRKHLSDASLQLLEDALSAGIGSIHVDLMYGLPDQAINDWRRTVEFTVSLPIQHISAYKLYVFEHGTLHRAKILPRAEEEDRERIKLLEEMYDLAVSIFEVNGFVQYTLTEFAQPGYQCKYLLDTFGGRDILPLGPSAFGRCGNEVWHNPGLVHLYGQPEAWDARRQAYTPDPREAFKRDVILGLWLLKVDLEGAAFNAGVTPSDELRTEIRQLCEDGLLSAEGSAIWLDSGQRFGVGKAMKRLAGLDARSWGDVDEGYVADSPRQKVIRTSGIVSPQANAILRTARRDPKFFHDILREPAKVLSEVGGQLTPDELAALIAITSGQEPRSDPLSTSLTEAWRAVQREHCLDRYHVDLPQGSS